MVKSLLFSMALMATVSTLNAQEIWDASSLKEIYTDSENGNTKCRVKTDAYTVSDNKMTNMILHSQSDPYDAGTNASTVTATEGEALKDYVITGSTENVTMTIVATPNPDALASEVYTFGLGIIPDVTTSNKSLNTDRCSHQFTDFLKIKSGNPSVQFIGWWEKDGSKTVFRSSETYWDLTQTKVPEKGAYHTFDVKKDGLLEAAIYLNRATDACVVLDVNADGTYSKMDASKIYANGYVNNNTMTFYATDVEDATQKVVYNPETFLLEFPTALSKNFFGYIVIKAEAGHKYMFFTPTGQIGIYGFAFGSENEIKTGVSPIVAAPSDDDAAIYTIGGVRVSNTQAGKIYIQNGKKFIAE